MNALLWHKVLLLALPVVPALGALLAGMVPSKAARLIRATGWIFSFVTLVLWVGLRLSFPSGDGLVLEVRAPWVTDLGIGLHFGLDWNGLLMSGLIALVAFAATVGTLPSLPELNRAHVVCLLMAEAGMMGVVTSWDLILFISFWEITLVPFFFLMGKGPSRGGVPAASRFFITSVMSSVLMWVGVLVLVKAAGLPRTFDLVELANRLGQESMCLAAGVWLIAPAFFMRMAIVPLHTWFPVASANVSTAASVMLAGGVVPLGGFGLVHVLDRLLGPSLCGLGQWAVWIGLVTGLSGAVASLVQRDLKRFLSFICTAWAGLSLVALGLPDASAHSAGLILLVASGISGATLFLFVGVVCRARGSQRVLELGGVGHARPAFVGFAFAAVASLSALPGTLGFSAISLLLKASLGEPWIVYCLALTLFLIGASTLWTFWRVIGGSFQEEVWTHEKWPLRRQVFIMVLITAVVLVGGLLPTWLLAPGQGPVAGWSIGERLP